MTSWQRSLKEPAWQRVFCCLKKSQLDNKNWEELGVTGYPARYWMD
jgi:hypothetical protein